MEVGVHAAEQLGLLPGERVHAEPRLPVELHQGGLAGGVDEAERVDTEPLHVPVRARDGAVGHRPDRVVLRLGVQRDEVPEGVVRRLRLRDLAVGVRLGGVDDVRELDAVLDEEHRDVVADQVEDALLGVELRREAPGVAHRVGRAARPGDRREPHEHRCLDVLLEEGGRGELRRACRTPTKVPCAPVPRAWTTRSGMRSWSKWVIFSRRWWSWSRVGPRWPASQRVVGVAQPGAQGRGEERLLLAGRHGVCPGLGAGGGHRLRRVLLGLGRQRVVGSSRLLEGDRCKGRRTGRRRGAAGRLGRLGRARGGLRGLGRLRCRAHGARLPGLRLSMHPRRRVCPTSRRVGHRFRQRTEDAPQEDPGCAPPPSGRRRP